MRRKVYIFRIKASLVIRLLSSACYTLTDEVPVDLGPRRRLGSAKATVVPSNFTQPEIDTVQEAKKNAFVQLNLIHKKKEALVKELAKVSLYNTDRLVVRLY